MNTTAVSPIEETVHFHVTVSAVEREGHWVARTLETTIFAYGDTRKAAEDSAGDANVLIIKELKLQGMQALKAFMHKYGIDYSIGTDNDRGGRGAGRHALRRVEAPGDSPQGA
jgi:hypothetical protein